MSLQAEIITKDSTVLWLGSFPGQIHSLEEKIHVATTGGEILLLKEEGDQVTPHEAWALMNRDRLHMKEKSFSLAERGFELSLNEQGRKQEEEQELLDTRLETIVEERKRLEKLSEVTGASEFSAEISDALEKLKVEQEKLLLKFENKYSPSKLSYDRDQLKLSMEQKRKELESYREDSHLKAGVTGTIQYLIHENSYEPDTPNVANVSPGDPIAIIRNDDVILVYIPEKSFDAILLPNRDYFSRVTSESGMSLVAYYHDEHTIIEDGVAATYYRFAISKGDHGVAKKAIGESCIINILQRFPKAVQMVEKEDFIKVAPDLVKEEGWESAVLKSFPGMKLAGVGKGAIALEPRSPK